MGGVGEGTGRGGGDMVVGSGGHHYGGCKGSGGGGSGGGRGQGGGVTEGAKRKTPGTEHQKIVQVENLAN